MKKSQNNRTLIFLLFVVGLSTFVQHYAMFRQFQRRVQQTSTKKSLGTKKPTAKRYITRKNLYKGHWKRKFKSAFPRRITGKQKIMVLGAGVAGYTWWDNIKSFFGWKTKEVQELPLRGAREDSKFLVFKPTSGFMKKVGDDSFIWEQGAQINREDNDFHTIFYEELTRTGKGFRGGAEYPVRVTLIDKSGNKVAQFALGIDNEHKFAEIKLSSYIERDPENNEELFDFVCTELRNRGITFILNKTARVENHKILEGWTGNKNGTFFLTPEWDTSALKEFK